MRYSHLISTILWSGAFAIPIAEPQDLDIDAYNAICWAPAVGAPLGNTVTTAAAYNPTAVVASVIASDISIAAAATTTADACAATETPAASRLTKRGSCAPQSPGNYITIGPPVAPDDSPNSFLNYAPFTSTAMNAVAPPDYVLVPGFQNLQYSAQNPTYLTYISSGLTFYDVNQCAAKCDSILGCSSFNIYYERDPSLDPDDVNCPNPSSVTNIKCAFFGSALTLAEATNGGQWRSSFDIVIAGSNAYNRVAPTCIPGFGCPTALNNATINAPSADGSYIRTQTFAQTQPYDPTVCAASCTQMSAYNLRHGNPTQCMFFNAYILYKDGGNGVFTCAYYTQPYGIQYATNQGQWRGSDHYTIGYSFTYSVQ